MPKEVICKPPSHPDDPGDPFCVHVGWNQDMDVHVGSVGRDGRSLFWLLLGDGMHQRETAPSTEALAQFGEIVSTAISGVSVEGTDRKVELAAKLLDALDSNYHYTGTFTTLGRPQVNQLIKALRRARDSAYGADE